MRDSVNGVVTEALEGSKSKAYILWDETLLFLVNFPREFLKQLEFVQRSIQIEKRSGKGRTQQQILREVIRPYNIFAREGVEVVMTYQGFWLKACLWAAANGVPYEFRDFRPKDLLPAPRLDLMFGFRFNQKSVLEQALTKEYSGVIAAVTRYGKSTLMRNTLRAYPGVPSVLIAPGKTLLKQTLAEMKETFPDREIKLIGAGSRVKYQSDDINIVSADSTHLLDAYAVRLVLVDECHTLVSEGRSGAVPGFPLARKIAFTATPEGRYDGRDKLIEGIFGPTLAKVTYKEAVALGAIAPIKVLMVPFAVPADPGARDFIYRKFILENSRLHALVATISAAIPAQDQTLIFIKQEKQARLLQGVLGDQVPLVMDKILTSSERDRLTALVAENQISRVLCSDIFVQGVTFHEIRYLINTAGGGPSTSAIQRPGRLAEVRPGKRFGVLVDFMPVHPSGMGHKHQLAKCTGIKAICREAKSRLEVYNNIGYQVSIVEPEEVVEWIKSNNTHVHSV